MGKRPVPPSGDPSWPGRVWESPAIADHDGVFVVARRDCPDQFIAVIPWGKADRVDRAAALRHARDLARDPSPGRIHRSPHSVGHGIGWSYELPVWPWFYRLQLRPPELPSALPIHPVPFCPFRFALMLTQAADRRFAWPTVDEVPYADLLRDGARADWLAGYEGEALLLRAAIEPGMSF